MATDTIEDALEAMGQTLANNPAIATAARQAIQAGGKYTVTIEVSANKHGGVVAMFGQPAEARQSFGQLIRLE